MLATSTWSGSGYQTYFETPEAVAKAIHDLGVAFVILDNSVPKAPPHQELLRTTLEREPNRLQGLFPMKRDSVSYPESIAVYNEP
jgi:hypothetical protein